MARSHAQLFANQTLAKAVFANPLSFTQAIANGTSDALLGALWSEAAGELAPIDHISNTGFLASMERRGLYTIAIIHPPAPHASGDPAMLAIIGRGDGISKMSTIAYYVLELQLSQHGPRFTIVSRTGLGERCTIAGEGPMPDPRWVAEHAFELYAGRTPVLRQGIPELPVWYWWQTFRPEAAIRKLVQASDLGARFDVVRDAPVLLLPEIAIAAEHYAGAPTAKLLADMRPYLRREKTMIPAWEACVELLATTNAGSAIINTLRAVPLIAETTQYNVLTREKGYELEARVRSRLAALGVDSHQNHALSEQLYTAARTAERTRIARGSAPPPISEDPVWKPLFLEEGDLPRELQRAERDEAFSSVEPTFVAHGGIRAGYHAWVSDETHAMARLVDQRWVFRTGLPPVPTPSIGSDDTLCFGGDAIIGGTQRRSQIIVVRIGRIVARLQATEGSWAAQSRNILHSATLHPYAHKIVQKAQQGLAAYWLAVVYPTNAVPALVHSPGHDAARLLEKYPYLGLAELPAAVRTMGDQYAPVARSLASFQAQVRAHRWQTYRSAMLALVQQLLTTDMGDMRVNAATAHEIVCELRYLDNDPVWIQLDAECRARC
jgi:hypothetical protein